MSLKACHMSHVTLSNVTCSNRLWGDLTSSSHCSLLGPLNNVALSHIACHIYQMLDCHRSHMSQVKLSHSQLWLRIMSHCHILHLSLVTNAESLEAMWHAMRLGHQVMAPWGRKIRGRYHRSLALRPCLGWPQNIEAIIKLHCALCITPTVSVAAILAVLASLDGLHWLRGFFFARSTKLYLMTMSTDMQMMFFAQTWTGKQLFQDVVNGKEIYFEASSYCASGGCLYQWQPS